MYYYYTRFFVAGKEKQGEKYKKNIFFYKRALTFGVKCVTMKGKTKPKREILCKRRCRTTMRDIDNG